MDASLLRETHRARIYRRHELQVDASLLDVRDGYIVDGANTAARAGDIIWRVNGVPYDEECRTLSGNMRLTVLRPSKWLRFLTRIKLIVERVRRPRFHPGHDL